MGHESLIRGPADSPLRAPDVLFAAARAEDLTVELEQACLGEGLRAWAEHAHDKRLFLNLSAQAMVAMFERLSLGGVMKALQATGVSLAALVIEITEHERVTDLPRFISVAAALRARGLRFALDEHLCAAASTLTTVTAFAVFSRAPPCPSGLFRCVRALSPGPNRWHRQRQAPSTRRRFRAWGSPSR